METEDTFVVSERARPTIFCRDELRNKRVWFPASLPVALFRLRFAPGVLCFSRDDWPKNLG